VFRVLVLALVLSSAAVAQRQIQPITLDEAVKLALQLNPDLQRQILLSLSSDQDRVIARAQILPQLSFNASRAQIRQGEGSVAGRSGSEVARGECDDVSE